MEPLSNEWRLEKIRLGDVNMEQLDKLMKEQILGKELDVRQSTVLLQMAQVIVSTAQAHYLAANVRRSRD